MSDKLLSVENNQVIELKIRVLMKKDHQELKLYGYDNSITGYETGKPTRTFGTDGIGHTAQAIYMLVEQYKRDGCELLELTNATGIEVGATVIYRPGFGMFEPIQATIREIDEKNGKPLVVLDNNNWAYFQQIDSVVELTEKEKNCQCHNTESDFYQEHGCCYWCYFVGEGA